MADQRIPEELIKLAMTVRSWGQGSGVIVCDSILFICRTRDFIALDKSTPIRGIRGVVQQFKGRSHGLVSEQQKWYIPFP